MKTYISKLIQPITMPAAWQDFFLAIPRIACGYMLTSNFGAAKFGMPWSPANNNLSLFEVAFWFPGDIAQFGSVFALFPVFFAWMGAFAEAFGGLCLVLGLQTRLFAFLNLCTMAVAVFLQQSHNGLWNMLPGLGFMWVSMFYMILGSGRFGLDYFLAKKPSMQWASIALVLSPCIVLLLGLGLQKTTTEKLTVYLDTRSYKGEIKEVGLRGQGGPLKWGKDFPLTKTAQEGIYTAELSAETAYKAVDVKFTINQEFEFDNEANRTVTLDPSHTTTYKAVYNKR
jgi:putative oxidoreductase